MAMVTEDEKGLLELFEEMVPAGRWREWEGEKRRAQVYALPVVVGMMLWQRLSERGTQQEAVEQMAMGRWDGLLPDSQRVREKRLSVNTGGYARACGRVTVATMEKVCDEVLEKLGQRIEAEPELKVPLLLLDGSSLQLEHAEDILDNFPPSRNQRGMGHWGVMKWVGLHDMQTGIALRPAWGAMYGEQAVSEQQLAEEVLKRVEGGSVIVGDGNFGIFSMAYSVVEKGKQVLFRLTESRAKYLGEKELPSQGEQRLIWRPSRHDRMRHPELPVDAQIEGRLLSVTRPGSDKTLYLFTTLTHPVEKVASWYSLRWNMELDLRTLKGTMRLRHLRGKSIEAVEKELLVAVVAYGLVRAFMALAARRAQVPPRQLSFTRCYGLLNAMIGTLYLDDPQQRRRDFDRLLDYMSKAKLPKRSHPRSYPRATWGRGKYYPGRTSQNAQEKSK
jgi:putative transposase